jgi:hypothetical protein
MNPETLHARTLDIAWLGLILLTALTWWANQGAASDAFIFAGTVFKSAVVAAIFMGLWRASRWLFLGLTAFLAMVAVILVALLT